MSNVFSISHKYTYYVDDTMSYQMSLRLNLAFRSSRDIEFDPWFMTRFILSSLDYKDLYVLGSLYRY